MSNIDSLRTPKEKRINVKPINLIRQEVYAANNSEDPAKEKLDVQADILKAKDELEQLEQQRESMAAQVNAEIEQKKKDWEQEKQTYIDRATEEGYEAGFEKGEKKSLEEYQQLIDKANAIVASAIADYHSTIEQSDEQILQLAMHTAEKIMNQQLSDNPEAFLEIVKAAIKEMKENAVVSIYLHPDNYDFVFQQKDELVRLLDADVKISIYSNDEITKKSCLIEHPFGQMDASVDTQLQQIRDVLLEIALERKQ